ncbi:CAH9 anhydrase, partial [Aegotheles bennettii]|nr:CAH9 anhydrase [Aegotheles bennettii]
VVLELSESLAITRGYAQQYQAMQLHLHWGSLLGPPYGGEHLLEVPILHQGCMFPFQIHVVHYNTKYDTFKEAMVHLDSLAVLGAFLEMSQPGGELNPGGLPHSCSMVFLLPGEEVLVPGFNIADLFPTNLKLYFHYNGFLTIPSCYQMVKWTAFNQTMLLSHDHMSVLVTSLRNDKSKPLQNNFQLVQDLHRQQVLASFQTTLLLVKQLPSGDVLAVLFWVLFAIMALAFLL